MKKGVIFIVSGPSGVGKKTIIDKIIFKDYLNLKYSISSTTREPRFGEKNGVDYFFISNKEFDKKIKESEFLEWVEFAGNRYGTSKKEVQKILENGNNVILEIEVEGGQNILNMMKGGNYSSIFIIPPSIEELERRLNMRATESSEKIKMRIEKAKKEMNLSYIYDKVVLNDDIDSAAFKIEKIIKEYINEK